MDEDNEAGRDGTPPQPSRRKEILDAWTRVKMSQPGMVAMGGTSAIHGPTSPVATGRNRSMPWEDSEQMDEAATHMNHNSDNRLLMARAAVGSAASFITSNAGSARVVNDSFRRWHFSSTNMFVQIVVCFFICLQEMYSTYQKPAGAQWDEPHSFVSWMLSWTFLVSEHANALTRERAKSRT